MHTPQLVKNLIGIKMMPDRWHLSQSIYKALGIPAQFVIPFLNKRPSLTKNWFVVAQFIARLTCGCLTAFQNLYNATLFFRFGITYNNTGHEVKDEMIDDITAFFKANAGDEIVEIVPHQYPSEK